MPKVKKGNIYKKQYEEKQMQDAIDAVKKGMTKRAACKKYGVPRSTIAFRMSESFVKTTPGPSPVLGRSGEDDLVKWIIECNKKGFPRRKENIQASVKEYLNQSGLKNPFHNNIPGNGWYKSFLKRNPNITERFPEGVTSASSCVSESDIRNWFKEISNYLSEKNYLHILEDSTRIFNSDETYFMVCPKMKNVLAPRGTQNVYEINKGNAKLNLTVLFTFSANGVTTPPTLVYPYKRLPSTIARSVPDNWGIGVTPSGWMNAELFCEYLKNIFHPYLKKEKIIFPVILFVDGHSSHVTLQVSDLCSELEIILICLYPNSTRMLQPADVAVFKPLKNMWKRSVLQWRQQNPTQTLSLDKMAPILQNAVENFSPDGSTIKNGFKACGLYPWNPDAIDYSKCLADTTKKDENIQNNHPSNTAIVSYETYTQIVGSDLLNQLESFNSQSERVLEEKSAEFYALYKLLEEYKKSPNRTDQITNQEINSDLIPDNGTESLIQMEVQMELEMENNDHRIPLFFKDIDLQDNSAITANNSAQDIMTPINDMLVNICDVKNVVAQDSSIVNMDNINYVIVINEAENSKLESLKVSNNITSINNNKNNEICNVEMINAENSNLNDLEIGNNVTSINVSTNNENDNLINNMTNSKAQNIELTNLCILNNNAIAVHETENKILDLSLSHRRNCPKKLCEFLERPPTPKRKGKKFTEKTSYAISSLEWKLNEQKKIDKQKMELNKKEAKKLKMLEKKK